LEDKIWLVEVALAESRGEGTEGMRAVMHTVLNRVLDGRWPSTIYGVVTQPRQFSGIEFDDDGKALLGYTFLRRKAFYAARALADVVAELPDITDGANHFYAHDLIAPPSWAKRMQVTAVIGGHTFLKG
jgi:spore germination cell wall hydrolase CwlJ-like protein